MVEDDSAYWVCDGEDGWPRQLDNEEIIIARCRPNFTLILLKYCAEP
jgi:hypothetical protein